MKAKGNIYCKICEEENIKLAIIKASKNKGHRKDVRKVMNNIEQYTKIIQNILIEKTYIPNPYIKKSIYDGANKKERIIYKPCFFPDQIIHWTLMLQIRDILKRGMYYYCCASVEGRGVHYGARHIKKILVRDRKNTKYCLKLDIKKYYPSVDKELLKKKFRRLIKCRDTLDLIDKIIDSSDEGLPIGNFTSQWFANFNLQDLDHFIKEQLKVKYYVRYMDDMVLFGRNKKELHKIKDEIRKFLAKEKLQLKENWQLFKTDSRPLDFMGFRFYRGYTTLRRGIFLRLKRRIKKIYKKDKISKSDAGAVMSYYGWIKHSNSYKLNEKYVKPYVSMAECKEVLKNENRKHSKTRKI